MKRIGLTLIAIVLLAFPLFSQTVSIPDTAFLYALIDEGVDTNGDSLISFEEAEAVTSLDVSNYGEGWYEEEGAASSLAGIEAFINLDTLYCSRNGLTSLDISNNIALRFLWCGGNDLTTLDVSNNNALTYLNVGCFHHGCADGNHLTSLDVSNNTALTHLSCAQNQLTTLDISANSALEYLSCEINQLTALDVSNNIALKLLKCGSNQLTGLDVTKNTALQYLICGQNYLINLDVSNNSSLTLFHCEDNQLTSLDVSANSVLHLLDCSENQLTSLDISHNSAITNLWINRMHSLQEVCVWELPFPPSGVDVYSSDSPNVKYTYCGVDIDGYTLSGLTIYPNPSNNLLTIETEYPDHYSINITSLNGQMIYSTKIKGITNQLDLSSFQKGVYLITIRSEDFVTTRKIIKL